MTDKDEEAPGQEVKARMTKVNMHYNYEEEVDRVAKVLEVVNGVFGNEENPHVEIDARGSIEDVFIKI
jgi:hypothetical protein